MKFWKGMNNVQSTNNNWIITIFNTYTHTHNDHIKFLFFYFLLFFWWFLSIKIWFLKLWTQSNLSYWECWRHNNNKICSENIRLICTWCMRRFCVFFFFLFMNERRNEGKMTHVMSGLSKYGVWFCVCFVYGIFEINRLKNEWKMFKRTWTDSLLSSFLYHAKPRSKF